MFARLASELGLRTTSKGGRLLQLSQFIKRHTLGSNRELVLVVEAHLLEWRTLEDIRLLTNSEMDSKSALTLVMPGQLWLRSKLKSMGNEALFQRMHFRYGLEGLTKALTKQYVRHHLNLVGCTKDVFSDDAIAEVFMSSGGILREINNISLECLIKAANLQLPQDRPKAGQGRC
jgi:type II secretory pathway predicted ATPase ExeA